LSLALREERRFSAFENMVLRIIFGPKRDEVTAGWKGLRNEALYDLYLKNSIRVIKSIMIWAGHVAYMG